MEQRATALLVDLCRSGVELRLTRDRRRITAPARVLTPDLREALTAHQSELLPLLCLVEDYRGLLRKTFTRLGGRRGLAAEEAGRFVHEQTRYMDELGPELLASVFGMVARAWRESTGICPWCVGGATCPDPLPHAR